MFCEIRNFTPLSESMPATDLVALLNELFTDLGANILAENGTIDKFIGDAIMGFWNAPIQSEHHRTHAAEASLRMRESLRRFNQNPERRPTENPVNRRLYSGGRRARAARAAHGDRTRKHRGHCADRICPSAVYHWSRDRRAQPVVRWPHHSGCRCAAIPDYVAFWVYCGQGANNHGTCRSSGRHAARASLHRHRNCGVVVAFGCQTFSGTFPT